MYVNYKAIGKPRFVRDWDNVILFLISINLSLFFSYSHNHKLNILIYRFRKIFKSITVDNGVEFSDFDGLERSSFDRAKKRTNVFYCHPYSAYERGTNERINRDIRRLLPKGTDFSKVSNKSIRFVESWVNSYPRKIFDFASSKDIFERYLTAL